MVGKRPAVCKFVARVMLGQIDLVCNETIFLILKGGIIRHDEELP
jgi:hypothetical protein